MSKVRNIITNIKKLLSNAHFRNRKKMLASMNIAPYPTQEELKDILPGSRLIDASPLSASDINENFTNIDDLAWLKPAAGEKKVFIMGETHYLQYIFNLKNRVFFALNEFDYFPAIILEDQYSKTPFVNYFLEIKDDGDADNYFRGALDDFITSREELVFLQNIRRWNKRRPEKAVKIGYSDIEFNYGVVFNKILTPYFKNLNASVDFTAERGLSPELFSRLESLSEQAREKRLVGDFPFITPDYIKNVVSNIKSTYNAQTFDFNYYRQKAIIRNLTDKRFLGGCFTEGKVMLCVGSSHACSKFKYPQEGGFLCEGSFLNHDYEPTKGKTYSLAVLGHACGLGEMKNIDPDHCLHQGAEYVWLIKKMQKALGRKLISPEKYYNPYGGNSGFERLLLKKACQHDHRPLLIQKIRWKKMPEDLKKQDKSISTTGDYYKRFDRIIFVPRSPLITARKKQ